MSAWDVIQPYLQNYDAFQDNPWPLLYRELDEAFPSSKFILTLRPVDDWYSSVLSHFSGKSTPMRKWIYGCGDPIGNKDIYTQRYESHNQAVKQYFSNRPNDLLVMNITEGDGWESLCRFLARPVPSSPFPFENPKISRVDGSCEEGAQ